MQQQEYAYASDQSDEEDGAQAVNVAELRSSLFGAQQKPPAVGIREGYTSLARGQQQQAPCTIQQLSIDVNELCYGINASGKKGSTEQQAVKLLLQRISFRVKAGEMIAIMGSSGAGKSTLLDLIAGRREIGMLSGTVRFNGQPLSSSIRRQSAYVQQTDVHLARLTVSAR